MHQQQTVVEISCMRCTEQSEPSQHMLELTLVDFWPLLRPRCLLNDLFKGGVQT